MIIGAILVILWIESFQAVSVNISSQLNTTTLSTTRPLNLETVAILLILVVVFGLLIMVIMQLIQRRKIVVEIKRFSNEIVQSGIKPIRKMYTYDEFEDIKAAYNRKINQIDEQVKRKDEYFNMTVHDLKVPIQAVKSNISLLEKFPDDVELVDDLKYDILELESEVARYLLLEKIDYFETADIQQVELNNYMRKILGKYLLESSAVRVEYSEQLYGNIDLKMFEKIVINLIQNGIQNSPDSCIRIKFKQDYITFSNYVVSPVEQVFYDERVSNPNGNGFGTQIIQKYIKLQGLDLEEDNTAREVRINIKFKD